MSTGNGQSTREIEQRATGVGRNESALVDRDDADAPSKESLIRRIVRWYRQIVQTIHVLRRAGRILMHTSLPRMAAALSYRTIFGLIPTLVIGIAVLGSFASPERMQETIRGLLEYSGISEIVIDQETVARAEAAAHYRPGLEFLAPKDPALQQSGPQQPGATGGSSGGMTSAPTGSAASASPPSAGAPGTDNAQAAPPISPRLDHWITDLVNRVQRIAFQAIGAIGVLMLAYAAISMLIEVERAFNDIYRAPRGRAWRQRIPLYWTMLTLGLTLVLFTFFLSARATAWLGDLSPALGQGSALGTLITFSATLLTSTLLFIGVYLWVPNTRVAWRPACIGAFVAALGWEISKLGLAQYTNFATGYARLYGSLGLIPLLLIWVYATWLIVLFGLQVAYALQHYKTWKAEDEARDAAPAVMEPAAVVVVAAEIARGFATGKAVLGGNLGTKVGLDDRAVQAIVQRLIAGGFASRLEQPDTGLTLSGPAERVRIEDLLRIGFDMAGPARGLAAELREQSVKAVEGRTLAGLVPAAVGGAAVATQGLAVLDGASPPERLAPQDGDRVRKSDDTAAEPTNDDATGRPPVDGESDADEFETESSDHERGAT
ncbi:MAG: YihY/virulence factor BrkB family protein [Phycisphaerales bacterium]|nr:YihY/virulence factor BrkB family protein [Phycisphaerales bacterium]MCB9840684.1 YihY/virulence factor BrkB family protein [Phycisphaeraceae bacterium]